MRVLVTGASGFIGSNVVRTLLSRGYDVLVIVRSGGLRRRIGEPSDRVTLVEGDLTVPSGWRAEVARWQPDSCIHLAWYAEPGKYIYARENLICLAYSLSLVEELATIGCRRIVIAGTCAEYDADAGYLREDAVTAPRSLYAASKLALYHLVTNLSEQLDIEIVWARLFYLYGPHEDGRRFVPSLIQSLLRGDPFAATDGRQVRDYLHVEDVADALAALAEHKGSGAFNVCSGIPLEMVGLMGIIGDMLGRRQLIRLGAVPHRREEPMFVCGDNTKLRVTTGWTPTHSLHSGLTGTIDWWREKEF